MKLNSAQLNEGQNLFSFSSSQDPWIKDLVTELKKQGEVLRAPIEISLNLTKLEPDYYMKGLLKCEVEQCCARCAEVFGLKVQHPFEIALAHTSATKAKEEVALSEDSDELDITFFDGPEIELTPLIREQFFLSLPYQALCKKDCRGVCQTCGQNLNIAECSCEKNASRLSPFEVLKTLKQPN